VLLSLWRVSDGSWSKIREAEFEFGVEDRSPFFLVLKFSLDGQAVAVCGDLDSKNVFLGLSKLDGTEDVCIAL
jgi:hypothetical protein